MNSNSKIEKKGRNWVVTFVLDDKWHINSDVYTLKIKGERAAREIEGWLADPALKQALATLAADCDPDDPADRFESLADVVKALLPR